jgi:hypothetical protein
MKLNYNLVWADTKLQTELLKISKFGGIPQSFLIDREGHLRGVFTSANPKTIAQLKEIVAKVVEGQDTPVTEQQTTSAEPAQAPILKQGDADAVAKDAAPATKDTKAAAATESK